MGDAGEGQLLNCHLYNDKELWEEADLDWYDYGFRNYDPQIGRFPQLDPLTWEYPELTNYQYASLDPIANVDLDGLEGVTTVGGFWNGSFLSNLPGVGNVVNPSLNLAKLGINAAVNTAQFLIVRSEQSTVTNNLQKSAVAQQSSLVSENQGPTISSWCQECETDAQKAANKAKLKRDFADIGKDENGDDFWSTKLAKNKNFSRFSEKIAIPIIIGLITEGMGSMFFSSSAKVGLETAGKGVNLGKKYVSYPVIKKVANLIPEGKRANHLFKGANKLADNPANRTLIETISNGKPLGVDAYGKSWYMGVDGAGKSVYTYTENGVVKGAGYATMSAKEMILKYGLK